MRCMALAGEAPRQWRCHKLSAVGGPVLGAGVKSWNRQASVVARFTPTLQGLPLGKIEAWDSRVVWFLLSSKVSVTPPGGAVTHSLCVRLGGEELGV